MANIESIVLGAGCFWCTEVVFKQLRGVVTVVPGYAGGELANPNYEQVCGGDTGHAEVIKVDFESDQISLETLLEVFFSIHNPTTLNQQGHDVGTQYRSVVFFNMPEQESVVKSKVLQLTNEHIYPDPIVTEIKLLDKFYEAEDYHHDYFKKNPDKVYCQLVINPKLQKFKEKWVKLLK